jgi:hypothetical protein
MFIKFTPGEIVITLKNGYRTEFDCELRTDSCYSCRTINSGLFLTISEEKFFWSFYKISKILRKN